MSTDQLSQDELKRAVLFTPCTSKAQLHRWILIFLGLDMPDCIVDPDSNCSPMDMIYEVYSKALENNDPEFDRVLYYACRDGFKTLAAAILEVLAIIHLNRSVAHMAAIESQSMKSSQYVKKFLSRPYLREFVVGNNKEIIWVVHYRHMETNVHITEDAYNQLSEDDKNKHEEMRYYLRIVICTMAGANSEHVPLFVIDEVDVVENPKAYEEAQSIPSSYEGKEPITLLTSTRKFATGLVQKEINNAAVTGLKVRHWNLIDVTEACPTSRHQPELPRVPVYVSDDALDVASVEKYEGKTSEEKEKYAPHQAYAGCLTNCKLFSVCKGRLATDQKSTSPLLKSITNTTNNFKKRSLPFAQSQLLCRKPSTEGMIYPNFDREIHMLTPAQMAERITGEQFDASLTKEQLIDLMLQWDLKPYGGMDFGFTHNFAAPYGFVDGMRAYVVGCISKAGLEPPGMIEECNKHFARMNPTIYADKENPMLIQILKKAGFRMRDWIKGPGSVAGGIDVVRTKLKPVMGDPQIFFLKGDEGAEKLASRLAAYHYKIDKTGKVSDEPDDEDDDECDGLRYWIMNVFASKGKVQGAPTSNPKPQTIEDIQAFHVKQAWAKIMADLGTDTDLTGVESKGKVGGFKFDLS